MNAKTLKALRASIAHWKRMRADINCDEAPFGSQCALCQIFLNQRNGKPDCVGCPFGTCEGRSPWSKAHSAWHDYLDYQGSREKYAWKRCATNMIRYMQRRLPKVAKKGAKR